MSSQIPSFLGTLNIQPCINVTLEEGVHYLVLYYYLVYIHIYSYFIHISLYAKGIMVHWISSVIRQILVSWLDKHALLCYIPVLSSEGDNVSR